MLALGPHTALSMTMGLCGTEVLGKLYFLQLPFSYTLFFMATQGFPWHGPRLLQAVGSAAIIDLHWNEIMGKWSCAEGKVQGRAQEDLQHLGCLPMFVLLSLLHSPFLFLSLIPHWLCSNWRGYMLGAVSMDWWACIFCRGFSTTRRELC